MFLRAQGASKVDQFKRLVYIETKQWLALKQQVAKKQVEVILVRHLRGKKLQVKEPGADRDAEDLSLPRQWIGRNQVNSWAWV